MLFTRSHIKHAHIYILSSLSLTLLLVLLRTWSIHSFHCGLGWHVNGACALGGEILPSEPNPASRCSSAWLRSIEKPTLATNKPVFSFARTKRTHTHTHTNKKQLVLLLNLWSSTEVQKEVKKSATCMIPTLF